MVPKDKMNAVLHTPANIQSLLQPPSQALQLGLHLPPGWPLTSYFNWNFIIGAS